MNRPGESSPDVFGGGLSVTLMAGLTFGSMLTMVIIPVLYATVFRIREIDYDR